MPIGAIIGGAVGLAGSLISGRQQRQHNQQMQHSAQQFSYEGQQREHAHSRESQERNIAHQKHMAQNTMQYKTADFRAAGLNPILAAQGGLGGAAGGQAGASGASAPSVAPGTSSDLGNPLASALDAYKNISSLSNQTNQTNSEVLLNSARGAAEMSKAALYRDKVDANVFGNSASEMAARTRLQERMMQSANYADNLQARRADLVQQEILLLQAEIKEMEDSAGYRRSRRDLNRAQAQLASKQSQLTDIHTARDRILKGMASWSVLDAEYNAREARARYTYPALHPGSHGFHRTISRMMPYDKRDPIRTVGHSAATTHQRTNNRR